MAQILVVDDDTQLRTSFGKLLKAEGHTVLVAGSGEDGVAVVEEHAPELVIMDVRLPGMNGLEAFQAMRAVDPQLPVIIMTAFGTTETAIQATKQGAFDYVLKPFDVPEMFALITKALTATAGATRSRAQAEADDSELLGRSAVMQELFKDIGRAAPTEATVLIQGESGTGKELVARALHRHSLRADKPFLVINCVAIPETLLESELFGYEKGAFTGANQRRVGRIEQANGGTVFLDEIGDMPGNIQAKILRLLQERQIERLGGGRTVNVDVRIVAATNRNLETAVREGAFREDLFYRLKVVALHLPPLRERLEDVPLLAERFLERYAAELRMHNPGLTKEGERLLREYDWPGNVRELANMLQRALIFSRGCALGREELEQVLRAKSAPNGVAESSVEASLASWIRHELALHGGENIHESLMDRFGAMVVREALAITDGNRTRAAKLLGLSRPTLLSKIEKYGITFETTVSTGNGC